MIDFQKCFIMLCNNRTEKECIGRNLLGDRKGRLEYLKDINTGDIGFLLNTSRNQLIGPFKAMSKAELDIEKDAWEGEFQAQVRVEPVGEMVKWSFVGQRRPYYRSEHLLYYRYSLH